MKKIIILDFTTGDVHIFNYDSNIYEDFSDFIEFINKEYGLSLKENQCNYMVVDKINMIIH